MVDVNTQNKTISVNVSSSVVSSNVNASGDTTLYYSNKAREWAISNRIVDGVDYSSKYYASKSNQSALNAQSFAQSAQDSYNNFQQSVDGVLSDIDSSVQEGVDVINNTKTEIINDIELVANGEKQEIEDLANLIKDNAQEIASRTSFAMFDTVLKDHILTYEESKGWALQGTYVYKDAIAGSRYGYPDFYAKCLEEYQNANSKTTYINSGIVWEQPTNPRGITGSSGFSNPNNAFDNDSSTYASCGTTTDYIEWDLEQTLYITGFSATGNYVSSGARACNLALYIVDTNGNETLIADGTGAGNTATYTTSATFDGVYANKIRFKISTNIEPSASYHSRFTQMNLVANTCIDIKHNSNGHQYYDIADKGGVDIFFNTMGTAWFYGVDTENERIYLPRNNYFEQTTGEISEVGQSVEAGLPNITGYVRAFCADTVAPEGAFTLTGDTSTIQGSTRNNLGINFNASLSNPIYGKSNTVQPKSVKKLLYICVGNTETVSSITDVVDVTTAEDDTTPLFTGMYFDFTPNNVSWLKAGQQANSGGIYATCYNELVNVLNGEIKYGDLKVVDTADMIAGIDYSEYWKVNQTDMTFTTPTAISNKALSGAVVGTGYGLGLTDGTSIGGLNQHTGGSYTYLQTFTGREGLANGSTYTSGKELKKDVTLGITTDPTKSGIIAEQSTAQLYFKVANAVQNLELLNVGEVLDVLANKVDINSKVIDGQWVGSVMELSNASTTGTYEIDLSSYLPDDSCYEIMVEGRWYSSSTDYKSIRVYSDIFTSECSVEVGNYNRNETLYKTVPVGASKKIILYINGSVETQHPLTAVAFRRLGTNQ